MLSSRDLLMLVGVDNQARYVQVNSRFGISTMGSVNLNEDVKHNRVQRMQSFLLSNQTKSLALTMQNSGKTEIGEESPAAQKTGRGHRKDKTKGSEQRRTEGRKR